MAEASDAMVKEKALKYKDAKVEAQAAAQAYAETKVAWDARIQTAEDEAIAQFEAAKTNIETLKAQRDTEMETLRTSAREKKMASVSARSAIFDLL